MCAQVPSAYDGDMSTTADHQSAVLVAESALDVATSFLHWLAAADFGAPAASLDADVTLKALLPPGYREWSGEEAVCAAFDAFFGGMDSFDVVEMSAARVGDRLQMRWRVHAGGGRLGAGDFVAEQSCYAELGAGGRIGSLSLVCSGFRDRSAHA